MLEQFLFLFRLKHVLDERYFEQIRVVGIVLSYAPTEQIVRSKQAFVARGEVHQVLVAPVVLGRRVQLNRFKVQHPGKFRGARNVD